MSGIRVNGNFGLRIREYPSTKTTSREQPRSQTLLHVGLCILVIVTFACRPSDPASEGDAGASAAPPGGSLSGAASSDHPQPNIILYVVDTLRADILSPYGGAVVATPAIERFANEGVVFERAYAQSSWTRSSISSMFTSIYPEVLGVNRRRDRIGKSALFLSEILREHGYRTGMIATNPNIGSFYGFDQGFDDFIEMYRRRRRGLVWPHELVATAEEVGAEATAWIAKARQPFFLTILTVDPHVPYRPPEAFDVYREPYHGQAKGNWNWAKRDNLTAADKRFIHSLYKGEVGYTDMGFGKFMDDLRESGLTDDTIVLFTSDHGEEFWELGIQGHGRSLNDTVIHIPLMVRYPRRIPAGKREPGVARGIDILPTLLDLADLPLPDGIDGVPLFRRSDEDRIAFSILDLDKVHLVSARQGNWKFIWDLANDRRALYDTTMGSEGSRDLREEEPERARQLERAIASYMKTNLERIRAAQGDSPEAARDEDLPDEQRRLLEVLGYIESEAAE